MGEPKDPIITVPQPVTPEPIVEESREQLLATNTALRREVIRLRIQIDSLKDSGYGKERSSGYNPTNLDNDFDPQQQLTDNSAIIDQNKELQRRIRQLEGVIEMKRSSPPDPNWRRKKNLFDLGDEDK